MSTSGVVQVKTAMDFDAGTRQYDMSIQVSDGANLVNIDGSVVVVAVNEAAPVFTSSGGSQLHGFKRIMGSREGCAMSYLKPE